MAKDGGADAATRAQLEKVKKLLAALRQVREQEQAIVDELDTILGGGVSIGELMVQGRKAWEAAYATRYKGGGYLWQMQRDMPNMKRLVKTLGIEELAARFGRFIRKDDDFYIRNRHAFGVFVSSVNEHAAASAGPIDDLELEPPADCKHSPPCKSDQEHTAKRMRELRGVPA